MRKVNNKFIQISIAILFSMVVILSFNSAKAQENYVLENSGVEQINNFDVNIRVNSDNSIEVRESIEYDFGVNQRHGIYRDIPYKYKTRNGNFTLKIRDIEVLQDDSLTPQFTTNYSGGYLHIKIGDPNNTISGMHTYRILYTVERALNYFEDHDELYWNVTGNEWKVPILNAKAEITVQGFEGSAQTKCFRGFTGSQTEDCKIENENGVPIIFSTSKLGVAEGMTIVMGWSKGLVKEPSKQERVIAWIKDNGIMVLPIFVFMMLFELWKRLGKDPKKSTIVAEYDSPNNMNPVELSLLKDGQLRVNKVISAQIIYLATKGYLKITRKEKEGWFGKEDFILMKTYTEDPPVVADKVLLSAVFKEGDMISLSAIKNDKSHIKHILDSFVTYKDKFETYGYFKKSSRGAGVALIVLGVMGIVFSFFLFFNSQNLSIILALGLSSFLAIIFGIIMPARTLEGARMYARMLGLREFIEVAEKDRIQFHDAPLKSPELFQKLLPFAILFGLEKNWAEKFIGIELKSDWYSDSSGVAFSSVAFTNSMNSFNSVAESSVVTASSGGSGFSGGGVGGGGGGGGGGSW